MNQVNTIETNPKLSSGSEQIITFPNVLTIVRIVLTPVFLVLIFSQVWFNKILALIVFTIASLTDLYDGKIARRDGTITAFGRFMDPLADKLLVSSALISFVMLGIVEAWLVAAMLIRDAAITGFRVFSIRKGKEVVTSRLAKWKTMLQLVLVFGILVFMNIRVIQAELTSSPLELTGVWSHLLLNSLVAGVTLFAVISGVHYLIANRRSTAETG
ncbi:CDP-diacylglycerol--glycerol-3-phosphate 3-phosphatidyltransferase [bacterium]|nr:CDP-diacylglycerol--glycerol-3-phosphate 3-phosphatidyltransferase [bacterium]